MNNREKGKKGKRKRNREKYAEKRIEECVLGLDNHSQTFILYSAIITVNPLMTCHITPKSLDTI